MLILTRKNGESIFIGDGIKVTVVEVKGNQVRLGIQASKDVRIYREEIYLQIIEENKAASSGAAELPEGFNMDAQKQDLPKKPGQVGIGSLLVKKTKKEEED